ncbi:hypothetical protein [Neptuniibacter sp. QD37_11]|uniref:hypothetical protein n=1 Tax=Neptuniibacter sp. QD37_11 TaxID=3398209 RepID=UPI0039F5664E
MSERDLNNYGPLSLGRTVSQRDLSQNEEFNSRVQQAVKSFNRRHKKTPVEVVIGPVDTRINHKVDSPESLERMQVIYDGIVEKTLKEDYYLAKATVKGNKEVFFDYSRMSARQNPLIRGYSEKLRLMVGQKVLKQGRRATPVDYMMTALAVSQGIPYDSGNWRESNFRSPAKVLIDNKGDCDEKSLLLGMVLKDIFPKHQVKVLGVWNKAEATGHAVTLFEWPYRKSPWPTLTIHGKKFLSLETTIPSEPGHLDSRVRRALKNRDYVTLDVY